MPKVECVCKRCGKTFYVFPAAIRKGGGKYCSRECQNQKLGEWRVCPTCGKEFYAQRSRIKRGESKYCSKTCSDPARGRKGEENANWKGGRFKRADGYIVIRTDDGKYRLEHG